MEEKIILILQYGVELAYTLIGLTALFGGKIKRQWLLVIGYAGFSILVCTSNIPSNYRLMMKLGILAWLLIYGISFFVISIDKPKKLGWIITRILILAYVDELIGMLVDDVVFIFNINVKSYRLNFFEYVLKLLIIILISIVYSKHKDYFQNWRFNSYIRKSMIPLLSFLTVEIMCLIIMINTLIEINSEWKQHLLGISLSFMSMISIGVFVVMVLYVKKSNEKMEYMLLMEKQLQEFQKNYYEVLLEKEEETKKYRHDMDSHLICLKSYANDSDLKGVKEYIRDMTDSMEKISRLSFKTGIKVFDIMLNQYVPQLPQGTEIQIKSNYKSEINIANMEQCAIFSNVIKNAVEAIQKLEKSPYYLKIDVIQGKDYLQVKVVNPTDDNNLYMDKDGTVQTSKKDKRNHGMGLQNVKKAIDKNNGRFCYYIENHEFICEIILPNCIEN